MNRLVHSAAIMVFLAFSTVAVSAGSSDWSTGYGYKVRLLDGNRLSDSTFHAALEVVLEDGWITYWRAPGDHGIPPQLNFENSGNVKKTAIHWPSPTIFESGSGMSVGYENHVILPITITPDVANQKVELNVHAFFGVCAEICVPAEANLSTLLDPTETKSDHQPIIEEALIRVPTKPQDNGLNIVTARFLPGEEAEQIDIELAVPEGVGELIVLVEGPQDWHFDPYRMTLKDNRINQNSSARVTFHRTDRDPLTGDEKLRVTIIADDDEAIERNIALR